MSIKRIEKPIPANIITGFLGVGKTTAIEALLAQKPAGERWAILINEFGEVGIDASLMGGPGGESKSVFIREVPGGCMCCAAGLPMQIALNQLITRARPDRLLIEPTGLGHPREVIGVLSHEVYREVVALRATLTLVDAKKIRLSRYADNDTFNQQLQVADIIVANKSDTYEEGDYQALKDYLRSKHWQDKPLHEVTQGRLMLQWLDTPRGEANLRGHNHYHAHDDPLPTMETDLPMPDCGYLRKDNEGDGFHSSGWIFDATMVFSYEQIFLIFTGVEAERLKAVMITERGVFSFNKAGKVLRCIELDDTLDSRIEVIDTNPNVWLGLEEALLSSRVVPT